MDRPRFLTLNAYNVNYRRPRLIWIGPKRGRIGPRILLLYSGLLVFVVVDWPLLFGLRRACDVGRKQNSFRQFRRVLFPSMQTREERPNGIQAKRLLASLLAGAPHKPRKMAPISETVRHSDLLFLKG